MFVAILCNMEKVRKMQKITCTLNECVLFWQCKEDKKKRTQKHAQHAFIKIVFKLFTF